MKRSFPILVFCLFLLCTSSAFCADEWLLQNSWFIDGKLYVAVRKLPDSGSEAFIVRLNPGGEFDQSFNHNGFLRIDGVPGFNDAQLMDLKKGPDGSLYILGNSRVPAAVQFNQELTGLENQL